VTFTKFLPVPILVSILAFVYMIIAGQFELIAWVAFITWAGYFLAGMDLKAAIRLAISFTLGILGGMAVVWLGTNVTSSWGTYAFPAAVAPVAFVIILLELVPWFDLAPGYFLGCAAFFAAGATNDIATFKAVLIPALIGVVLGLATDFLRGAVFNMQGIEDPLKKNRQAA